MADIELVIKIPEEMYGQIKDGYVPLGISKYLKNGTPLDDVLDKIRAEIIEDIEKYNDIYDDTCHGLRMALDIIDKHTKGIA